MTCVGVLDVAREALLRAQSRLGDRAADVAWIQADVTGVWSWKDVDIWHDRAVFHFLTERVDSTETLASELGAGFTLVDARAHLHTTPWGAPQPFQYSRFRKV